MPKSFYIIRCIDQELYLPLGKQRNVTSVELSSTSPPRLFKSKQAAQCALSYWLKGVWYTSYNEKWGSVELEVTPVPSRKEYKLIIVEVELVEKDV